MRATLSASAYRLIGLTFLAASSCSSHSTW